MLGGWIFLLAAVCGAARFAEAGNRPQLLWKFATNDWVIGLALGPDGAVYAGTWTGAIIYVLGPDGVLRRQASVRNSSKYGARGLAVGNDGTIYAESADERLYALTSDGLLKWKVQDGGLEVTVGRDGVVYADSFALDPRTGETKTRFPGPVLAVGDDSTIYVQYQGICAFDPSGLLKWKSQARVTGPVAVGSDGTIYFGSLYRPTVRDPVTGLSKNIFPPTGAPRYRVFALDPHSGSTKWSFKVRGKVFAVVRGTDAIYAGSYDGHVYALDSDTGALKWSFWAGGDWGKMPVHALAIGSDGTVYAGAGSFVEAIRPP